MSKLARGLSFFLIMAFAGVLIITGPASGTQFSGGNGLTIVQAPTLLAPGALNIKLHSRGFAKSFTAVTLTNATGAVSFNFGFSKRVELGITQILYQDLNFSARDPNELEQIPDDTYLRVKWGNYPFTLGNTFFKFGLLSLIFELLPPNLLIYLFLGCLILSVFVIKLFYCRFFEEKTVNLSNFRFKTNKILKYSLFIFTFLLITEIIIVYLDMLLNNLEIIDRYIFFYYLNLIFTDIGFIGIIGVYFSYYSFKKDRKIFYVLITWSIFLFFSAKTLLEFCKSFIVSSISVIILGSPCSYSWFVNN